MVLLFRGAQHGFDLRSPKPQFQNVVLLVTLGTFISYADISVQNGLQSLERDCVFRDWPISRNHKSGWEVAITLGRKI